MPLSYLGLFKSGELEKRAEKIRQRASPCVLCPFSCKASREKGVLGRCNVGMRPKVASWGPHFGEEAPLVGTRGSGTIFFSHCNLRCVYCQNCDISQSGNGKELSPRGLAEVMLELQERGCHNINLVSPTHFSHAVILALTHAIPMGLQVPIVYNSGGYDDADTLKLFDGIIDIYMPDFKFSDDEIAAKLTGAAGYPHIASVAVKEMYRQVGDLISDNRGVAVRGLLVRHLVLPEDLGGSKAVIDFIRRISSDTYINIMDQYHPAYRARSYAELGRRALITEYDEVVSYAARAGLKRIHGVTVR